MTNIATRTTVTMSVKRSKNQVRIWKLKKMSFLLTAESLQWWRWDDGLWQTVPDLNCGNRKGTAAMQL